MRLAFWVLYTQQVACNRGGNKPKKTWPTGKATATGRHSQLPLSAAVHDSDSESDWPTMLLFTVRWEAIVRALLVWGRCLLRLVRSLWYFHHLLLLLRPLLATTCSVLADTICWRVRKHYLSHVVIATPYYTPCTPAAAGGGAAAAAAAAGGAAAAAAGGGGGAGAGDKVYSFFCTKSHAYVPGAAPTHVPGGDYDLPPDPHADAQVSRTRAHARAHSLAHSHAHAHAHAHAHEHAHAHADTRAYARMHARSIRSSRRGGL